ncbi:MAG TPA: GAP family protein [Candidatus Saccharimonadales bacterium]|nr:GAP family protein [Candidatus Saccharimonadales bacterium]
MLTLFAAMVILGLSAIDPVGIGIMPILLTQPRPYTRSFAFLGGSFVSLLVMGVLCAHGLGRRILHFEEFHRWLLSSAEIVGGVILLAVAAGIYWQVRSRHASVRPSAWMTKRLQWDNWALGLLGAALVAVQSVFDVVFVFAMIRIGQLNVSNLTQVAAVATYAGAALALQLLVVAIYALAPAKQRAAALARVNRFLARYGNHTVIVVSTVLGVSLIANGLLTR